MWQSLSPERESAIEMEYEGAALVTGVAKESWAHSHKKSPSKADKIPWQEADVERINQNKYT